MRRGPASVGGGRRRAAPLIVAVALLAAAVVVDVLAHIGGLPALERPAHVATLAAMVAVLTVAVASGLRQQRHARPPELPSSRLDTAGTSNDNRSYL